MNKQIKPKGADKITKALNEAGIPTDSEYIVEMIEKRIANFAHEMQLYFYAGEPETVKWYTDNIKKLANAMEVYNTYMGV